MGSKTKNIVDRLSAFIEKTPLRCVGLMTGTSMDGLDICVVDTNIRPTPIEYEIRYFASIPFPEKLALDVRTALKGTTEQVCELNYNLGRWMADMVKNELSTHNLQNIDLIGSPGQTLHHVSGESTLQVGEPSYLAEATGVPVVADFRARDISIGGTGAPLIPLIDQWLFRGEEAVIALNVGGIANVTLLPPLNSHEDILGFDTGPGMALLDERYRRKTGDAYDPDGATALEGNPDDRLAKNWLSDEFIQKPPPKSTGRDVYGHAWLGDHQHELKPLSFADQLATLSLFTALSIYENCAEFISQVDCKRLIVGGGGSRHGSLMQQLTELFYPVKVKSTKSMGIDPDAKEALGFALLAAAYIQGIPGNIPSVTGARRPVVLGKLCL